MLSKKVITIIITLMFAVTCFPAMAETLAEQNETSSVIKMQMKPVVDRYNRLTEAEIAAKKFSDVEGHFGKTFVQKMAAINVLSGYPGGKFGPNDNLLACQYLTMIVHALGFNPETLPGQEYWKGCVNKALELKILEPGEVVNYLDPISRELAATIAFRTLMLYEARPTGAEVYYDYNVSKTTDYVKIADRYRDDVIMSIRMGLITGSNNLFVPKGTLTRAQGCVIVNKLIDSNIRIASVPQTNEIIAFKNGDCSEYYFPGSNPNKEYTFLPGSFPLNEVYDVVKTLVNSKGKVSGGYLVQGYDEKTQFFSADLYKDKETADRFLFQEPRLPTASASFAIWTDKVRTQGALEDKGSGYLYSLNVWDCLTYNNFMKEYTYEILKTLFGNDANKAIALHDKYLNIPLKGLEGTFETATINGRYLVIGGGKTGFYINVYAKGAIK